MGANYIIREVPESEYPAACEIYSTAFIDPQRSLDRQIAFVKDGLSLLLGCYDGDQLVGLTGVIDFDLRFGDRWIPCAGVAGVATLPSYRRQGVVKLLLTECLKIQHERRIPMACLWPFSYPFYKRMGWEVTDFQTEMESPITRLPDSGDARAYKMLPLNQFGAAMAVHERWCESTNLSMRRSNKRWQYMLSQPNKVFRLFVHNDGYMIWDIASGGSEQQLIVKEWGFTNRKALVDGLSLLSKMDSQFQSVKWRCADAEPFLKLMGNESPPAVHIMHGMMSRVVHVDAFREALPVKSIGLTIVDPLGVSGPVTGSGAGPGEIVQHVIALWKQPDPRLPDSLHGVIGDAPAFSVEQY
jgi:predicted acetyltransferase